jgi:ribosomal protein L37AE/L43A
MKCSVCNGEGTHGFTCAECKKFFCDLCSFNQKHRTATGDIVCEGCNHKFENEGKPPIKPTASLYAIYQKQNNKGDT